MRRSGSHEELAPVEAADLGGNHAEVGGVLAEQWKLPPAAGDTDPVSSRRNVTDPTLKRLTQIVHLGSRCADVFVDEDPTQAMPMFARNWRAAVQSVRAPTAMRC
jgi:hypothetical protein